MGFDGLRCATPILPVLVLIVGLLLRLWSCLNPPDISRNSASVA